MTILILIMIPVWLIMGFTQMIPAKPHNRVILENTLPKDKLQDPKVLALAKEYKKSIAFITAGGMLLTLLSALIPYDSLLMTGFFILLIGAIGVYYFCLITYIRKMRTLIVENHWELPTEAIIVDTKIIQEKNRKILPFTWLIACLVLSLILASLNFFIGSWIDGLGASAACIIMWSIFAISYYYISRFPIKSLSDDSQLNLQYNDLTKYYWSLSMVVMCFAFLPITMVPMALTSFSNQTSLIFSGVLLIAILVGCFFSIRCLFVLRKKQDQLLQQIPHQRYVGEDQYWRYGLYYNPDDTRLMVPDRVGFNIGMNMARPIAKVFMGVISVFVTGLLIFVTLPLFFYDFSPTAMQLDISQTTVTISAPLTKTSKIPLNKIEEVQLLDDIPKDSVRVNGTGTENYAVGSFRVKNKPATFLVNTKKAPILKITTSERDYYFTSNLPDATQEYLVTIEEMLAK
ncbi:putative membrane protein [Enterococcus sp. PF1-24]|uniref:PH domain-containing protein n=1 Tax=unclassified Enterococcus TaxID=2608891 RepID=UPI00247509E1|nr:MULTISPECIES: PH domain-containing protein [unclassified Enterococcus]MDH6365487.1 putative membrane protein [Enterococcus sp. PFB1-1]MDH6402588.1 putative membrane protein [Enterococcus sp. PF1-24]